MMKALILATAAAVVAVNSAAVVATAAPGVKDVSCSCRNFGSTRSRARTSRLHFTSPPSNASPHLQPSSRPVDPSAAPPAPNSSPAGFSEARRSNRRNRTRRTRDRCVRECRRTNRSNARCKNRCDKSVEEILDLFDMTGAHSFLPEDEDLEDEDFDFDLN